MLKPHRSLSTIFATVAAAGLCSAVRAQAVYITEFMASNASVIHDEDGEYADWVEIANLGLAAANLDGWFLSDNINNRQKWRIPAITLAPGEHRIIWASNKNRVNPAAPLHTNFKLDAGGEYLGLTRPDGVTVANEYAPTYPPQQTDISYGLSTDSVAATFVTPGDGCRAWVPTSGSSGTTWTSTAFVVPATWSTGTIGVGYERDTGFQSLISLDVNANMYGQGSSCYIRVPFMASSLPAFQHLTLRMKYDDGFVAYLNGVKIASANAPTTPAWNSVATQSHPDDQAVIYQDFDVTAAASGALVAGANVLAIHGLNTSATNSDFLIVPQLNATTSGSYDISTSRYFTFPTPGAMNSASEADRGPVITEEASLPAIPNDTDPIVVTARVQPNSAPTQTVQLKYRVNYGSLVTITMLDDGAHGDGAPGDGVFGATIPAAAAGPGQMVRWFISATDTANNQSRLPTFVSPTQSPEFFGTMIADPGANSQLPVLWWWVEDSNQAQTEEGTRCSLFYGGRFYDNVFVRLRGQTSASYPKPSYKLDFNTGDFFAYRPGFEPVEEINLQTTYADKAYVRQTLSWETYRDCGVAASDSIMLRVQQNGVFHSVAAFVEQPDERMLTRNGLDGDGALYKMYNGCFDAYFNVEKKTREFENNDDLNVMTTGTSLGTLEELTPFMFDHVDIPATISYLAATTIIHDNDAVDKNYYMYRDSEGSGEWTMLPWDKDLTFGRNYVGGSTVLTDDIWANHDPQSHPLFADEAHPKIDGPWNQFVDAMYREPSIRQMYLRRLRTLMDQFLQAPGTLPAQRYFENRLDALYAQCAPDVLQDRIRWGNPYGANQDFAAAIGILKSEYLDARRQHLFVTHSSGRGGIIPGKQSPLPTLSFGAIERSPSSGIQDEEYIQLLNPMNESVDVSGWRLEGDVSHTFRPGTVILSGGSMFISPNVVAFRARSISPHGGQGLFVQGNYHGHLSDPAQDLRLVDSTGRLVASIFGCYANCDQSSSLPVLTANDFQCFLNKFAASDPYANCDGSTAAPVLNANDFQCFLNSFASGCP